MPVSGSRPTTHANRLNPMIPSRNKLTGYTFYKSMFNVPEDQVKLSMLIFYQIKQSMPIFSQ